MFGAGHVIQGYDVGIVTMLLGVAWGTIFCGAGAGGAGGQSRGFNAAQILQFLAFGA